MEHEAKTQASGFPHAYLRKRLPQGKKKPGDTISVHILGLTIAQHDVPELIWSLDFANCHPGDTSGYPGLEPSRDNNCSPTGLYKVAA